MAEPTDIDGNNTLGNIGDSPTGKRFNGPLEKHSWCLVLKGWIYKSTDLRIRKILLNGFTNEEDHDLRLFSDMLNYQMEGKTENESTSLP